MKQPKIRFKGFEGVWETHEFDSVFSIVNDSNSNVPTSQYKSLGRYPIIDQSKDFIVGYTDGTNPIVPECGYVVFGDHTREFKYVDFPFYSGADGAQILRCKLNSRISKFIYYLCLSLVIPNTGYNRHFKYIKESVFHIPPSVAEQHQIASYFTSLDSLIQSTAKKIESLKQVKAASLQAMFPQEGETTPRLRFKGFEGEWEKVAIKNIASFSKGHGYSKSDLRDSGTLIILYGRMYTKYEVNINNIDTFVVPKPNSVYTFGDEVILPASGETPEDISCASAVTKKGIILGGDLNILRFDVKKNNTTFIALSLSSGKAKKELSNMAQGKSVVHLHNSDIEKVSIIMPCFAEQQQIASYFTTLDSQITLQFQRLEKLRQLKSACLDNMFV